MSPVSFWFALAVVGVVAVLASWRYLRLRGILARIQVLLREHSDDVLSATARQDSSAADRMVQRFLERQDEKLGKLESEGSRLAAVLDQMTDGVVIVDPQGLVRFANPSARRMFESEAPLGKTVAEVLRSHAMVALWRHSRQTQATQSETLELPSTKRHLQMVIMPDRHGGGSLILVQDITQLRRLEVVRRDFVSNISHELRTPLASLKALAETLQQGALADSEAGPHFVEQIIREVDALSQMTQELLDLSRIESGQASPTLSRCSPTRILAAAAERMQMQAERAGVALQVDAPDDLPDVRGDAARLEQVLVNLIHNAVKFTAPGGRISLLGEIHTSVPPTAHAPGSIRQIRFAVRDTGAGIPADDLPRIFERFYQVDKARTGGGTGLGLSISRHIVEAHSGRIWVESVEGQGSTFMFTVPEFVSDSVEGDANT
jgi:two-component system phosphate regulon sensor histidine kinase PhoR